MPSSIRSIRAMWLLPLVVATALPALGCGAVRGRRGMPQESGFLRDYSQLQPREGYEVQLVYVNPDADWSRYSAVEIDSVTLWATQANAKMPQKEQQMLTDLLYKALHDKLGAQFRMSDRPGPNVLRMRAALTQVKGANVPLRTISTIVPQMLLISISADCTSKMVPV